MGAFDVELAALGYRTISPTPTHKSNDDFVGPRWKGVCLGHCNASVCYPCPSNNRLTEAELIKVYEVHDKWRIDLEKYPQLAKRAAKEEHQFISLYPGYVEYKQRKELKSANLPDPEVVNK